MALKDGLWGGGGTHRSWPGGRGGRPRALVAGEGWVGCRGDAGGLGKSREGVREGLAWRSGGVQGLRLRGVGGRGHGPQDGANFATCVVFLSFLPIPLEEKWLFLKDAL